MRTPGGFCFDVQLRGPRPRKAYLCVEVAAGEQAIAR
jgi:hypothetical protein